MTRPVPADSTTRAEARLREPAENMPVVRRATGRASSSSRRNPAIMETRASSCAGSLSASKRLSTCLAALQRVPSEHSAFATAANVSATAVANDDREEPSLSDQQRNDCLEALERDGFCILPLRLSTEMVARANAYMDGYCASASRCNRPLLSEAENKHNPTITGNGLLQEYVRSLNLNLAPSGHHWDICFE